MSGPRATHRLSAAAPTPVLSEAKSRTPARPRFRVTTALLMLITLLALTGCGEGLGFMAAAFGGDRKVDAVFKPPDRSTVILVDDPEELLTRPDLRSRIAGRIGDAFEEYDAVSQVVSPAELTRLRSEHDEFDTWPIDRVGRQLGAAQVLYVLVQRFDLVEEGVIYRPVAEVRVKLIDAATGERLFPAASPAGYPVEVERAYQGMTEVDEKTDPLVARDLAEALAWEIARLFFEHEPAPVGSRLPG